MKPIFIFRHWPSEGPGYLVEVLERMDLPWRLIAIDAGDVLPDKPEAASALIFMGGPMSANDSFDWLEQEIRLIRAAHAREMPILGHCLGGQIIAKALGGIVTRNPVREIGWLPVTTADNGSALDWFGGFPSRFEVFHWHGETFSLPAGASLILSSRHCLHQGFVVGKTLAFQCHLEMTENLVRTWAFDHANASELVNPSETIQSPTTMTTDLPNRIKNLNRIADSVYQRWCSSIPVD